MEIVKLNGVDISQYVTSFERYDETTQLIGGTVSTQIKLKIRNEGNQLNFDYPFSIGSKNYIVYERPEKWTSLASITLYDLMINTNIAYKTSLEYPVTISDQLDEMSSLCGVIIDKTTLSQGVLAKEVDWYDDTMIIRNYLGFIAECDGKNVYIDDNNKIVFKAIAQNTKEIDFCNDYELNELVNFTRVCLDNGITIPLEKGNDDGNTLYFSGNNSYASQNDIDRVYDMYNGLSFYSFKKLNTYAIEGFSLTDKVSYGDITVLPISCKSTAYGGEAKDMYELSCDIALKSMDSVIVRDDQTLKIKRIQTEIDQNKQTMTIMAQNIDKNSSDIGQLQISTESIVQKVEEISSEISAITRGEILQSISAQYGINDTDESPPTEYSDTFPESYDNKYLWLRNVYTYEKSVDYGDPILLGLNDTANQKAITSVDLLYVISNDGEEAPTSGWSEELGEWLPDQYVWQKELITFSDNTSKETDPRVIGGIKSGKTIITSDTAPTDNSALWLDTSKEPNQLKENVNGEWVIVNDQSGLINEQIGQVIEDTSSEIEVLKNQVITQISSIQTITDDQEERINELNTQVSTSLNGLTVTQTQLDSIKDQLTNDYVTNATWESVIQLGDGRLAISVSNSPFKMVLSNSELAFYDGDERIAWISNSEFHNAKAVITKEILLGDDDHRLSWEFIPDVGWVRRIK